MTFINQMDTKTLFAIFAIVITITAILVYTFYKMIKQEQKDREKEAINSISEFYAVKADLQQHLKDDGFIEPKPGSEEHFLRWKAEREKQTREP